MSIERDHLTFSKSLLRRLASVGSQEAILTVGGRKLRGLSAVEYLDSLPLEQLFVSDCPEPNPDGSCGCPQRQAKKLNR